MKKKLAILAAVLGLLAVSGFAAAAELQDDDPEDTVFNYGYDEDKNVLVWGTSASDGLHDCTLEDGPVDTTYGSSEDGVIQIPLLERDGGPVSFPARPQDELADGLIQAPGPIDYSGSDGECGVTGVSVLGPNGQVNHGMFMKSFNSVWDGPGRGCVNRHLAQSDLGKGDQQIQVAGVDPNSPELMEGDQGTIDFTTVLADCQHGNEEHLTGQERAAANKAAAAEKEKGKSGSAPGQSGSSGNSGPAQSNSGSPGKSGSAPGHNK